MFYDWVAVLVLSEFLLDLGEGELAELGDEGGVLVVEEVFHFYLFLL